MYKVDVFASARECARYQLGETVVLDEVLAELGITLNQKIYHVVEFGARVVVQINLNWLEVGLLIRL